MILVLEVQDGQSKDTKLTGMIQVWVMAFCDVLYHTSGEFSASYGSKKKEDSSIDTLS